MVQGRWLASGQSEARLRAQLQKHIRAGCLSRHLNGRAVWFEVHSARHPEWRGGAESADRALLQKRFQFGINDNDQMTVLTCHSMLSGGVLPGGHLLTSTATLDPALSNSLEGSSRSAKRAGFVLRTGRI
jgi:hypothetical protein